MTGGSLLPMELLDLSINHELSFFLHGDDPSATEAATDPPFDSAAQEATLGLVRTAHQLLRHFSSVVEPHGITVQQFNVLRILRGASPEVLPTLEIAERMVEQTPGVTRLLTGSRPSG